MIDYSKKLNRLIPGGAHTYSRGDDQYPSNAPPILERGKGAYLWDTNGNKFLDYGMGLRAVTLGYDCNPVSQAAIAEIHKGNNLPRASLTEYKAAELFTQLIPCAEMVKFAKNGSTVTTAAVKLARAYTGRKYIAICGDHPFFSYDDWFIGTTPMQRGIPQEIISLTLSFHYNDIASLQNLFNEYPNQIAAVILEPTTYIPPKENFLHRVKEICTKNKAVFILDEMITGFRWHLQGAQKYFDVIPDLATFGKGMANGFSLTALAGKREIMQLGGIKDEGAERVFLISTTHGAEMCALGAFIRTAEVYKEKRVVKHLWSFGKKLIDGINNIAYELGIENYFSAGGYPCSPYYFTKDKNNNLSLEFRTLFLQEMLKNGVLIPWIAISFSHGEKELELTLNAVKKSLKVYQQALENGIDKYLKGKIIKPVFRRYN